MPISFDQYKQQNGINTSPGPRSLAPSPALSFEEYKKTKVPAQQPFSATELIPFNPIEGLKSLGSNILGGAAQAGAGVGNIAKGLMGGLGEAVKTLNPMSWDFSPTGNVQLNQTLERSAGTVAKGISDLTGGAARMTFAPELASYETFTPDVIKNRVVNPILGTVGSLAQKGMYKAGVQPGSVEEQAITGGALGTLGMFGAKSKLTGGIVEKPAAMVRNPLEKVGPKAGEFVSKTGRTAETVTEYLREHATGIPRLIQKDIKQYPQEVLDAMRSYGEGKSPKEALVDEFHGALMGRLKELSGTGKEYGTFRSAGGTVGIPKKAVENYFKSKGITIKNGELQFNPQEMTQNLSKADQASLQYLFDQYLRSQYVKQGASMSFSHNGLLNLREAIDEVSNWSEGKTNKSDLVAQGLRHTIDSYSPKELKAIDAQYAPEVSLLAPIRQKLLKSMKTGELRDNAFSVILNSIREGKGEFLKKLETIYPGIESKIKAANAADIIVNKASAQQSMTGAFGKGVVGAITGATTGSTYGPIGTIAGGVAGAAITSPRIAGEYLARTSLARKSIESGLRGEMKGGFVDLSGKSPGEGFNNAGKAVSSIEDALLSEAKKYKSAEEFVKSKTHHSTIGFGHPLFPNTNEVVGSSKLPEIIRKFNDLERGSRTGNIKLKIGKPKFDSNGEASISFGPAQIKIKKSHSYGTPNDTFYSGELSIDGVKNFGTYKGKTLKELSNNIQHEGYNAYGIGADTIVEKAGKMGDEFSALIDRALSKDMEKLPVNISSDINIPHSSFHIAQDLGRAWEINKATAHGFLTNSSTRSRLFAEKTKYIKDAIKKIKDIKDSGIIYGEKDGVTYFDVGNRQISFHGHYGDGDVPLYNGEWVGKRTNVNPLSMTNKEYDNFLKFTPKKIRSDDILGGEIYESYGIHPLTQQLTDLWNKAHGK